MEPDALDDLVRRLTALVVKIDDRDTQMVDRMDQHAAQLAELREFNRQQVLVNERLATAIERLDTLITRVFAPRTNGHN